MDPFQERVELMLNPRMRVLFVGGALLALLPVSMANAQKFQPFGPLDFTQDWQPFAPAEISSYGGGIEPNTGFFFTYDRIHLWVNRPATALMPNKLDRTTGTRIDFGYMSDSNNGWIGELMSINGPNVYDEPTDRQRDLVVINPSGINPTNGEPEINVPPVVTEPYPNGRAENVGSLTSFEFSKLWRLKPLHGRGKDGGSHVEWFLGGRFTTIKAQDSYNYNPNVTIDVDGRPTFPLQVFPPEGISPAFNVNDQEVTIPTALDAQALSVRQYTPLGVMAENSIFGPQLGVRWFRQRGRWTISAEGRGFFAVNRQEIMGGYTVQNPAPVNAQAQVPAQGDTVGYQLRNIQPSETTLPETIVSPLPMNVPVAPSNRQVTTYHEKQWKWAPAGDVRVNASWEITKSFALEAGWEWLYFANGIARGKSDGPNNHANTLGVFGLDDQDMMFTGWTVGFVINR